MRIYRTDASELWELGEHRTFSTLAELAGKLESQARTLNQGSLGTETKESIEVKALACKCLVRASMLHRLHECLAVGDLEMLRRKLAAEDRPVHLSLRYVFMAGRLRRTFRLPALAQAVWDATKSHCRATDLFYSLESFALEPETWPRRCSGSVVSCRASFNWQNVDSVRPERLDSPEILMAPYTIELDDADYKILERCATAAGLSIRGFLKSLISGSRVQSPSPAGASRWA